MINQEVISLIWKSVPEASNSDQSVQQAQQQKSKYDTNRMQTQHADSTGMGLQAPANPQADQAPMGPNVKRKPVEVAQEPGRNDTVTIQNMSTGDTETMKWKFAKPKVEREGWVIVEH
jgi:preprotein translocase subunit SecA